MSWPQSDIASISSAFDRADGMELSSYHALRKFELPNQTWSCLSLDGTERYRFDPAAEGGRIIIERAADNHPMVCIQLDSAGYLASYEGYDGQNQALTYVQHDFAQGRSLIAEIQEGELLPAIDAHLELSELQHVVAILRERVANLLVAGQNPEIAVLLASSLESNAEQEAAKPIQRYKKVVFGHHLLDRDQIALYYAALKLGLIEVTTPVEVTYSVSDEDIDDNDVLVIEGLPNSLKDQQHRLNNKRTGNFDDRGDQAASFDFVNRAYQSEVSQLQITHPGEANKLQTLTNWVNWRDGEPTRRRAGGRADLPRVPAQIKDNLSLVTTNVLLGLEASEELNLAQKLSIAVAAIDKALDTDQNRASLREAYAIPIARHELMLNSNHERLTAAIDDPLRHQRVVSAQGMVIGFLDLRGLGIAHGGMSALRNTGADLIVLFDDQLDDEGEAVGFSLRAELTEGGQDRYPHLSGLIVDLLATRLQANEQAFGGGFEQASGYTFAGENEHLLCSPRDGSSLAVGLVQESLADFFDQERYSESVFHEVVQRELVPLLRGVATLSGFESMTGSDPHRLPDLVARFTVELGGREQRVINLSESDLPFYLEILKKEPYLARALMEDKSDISESSVIVSLRSQKARESLGGAIVHNNAQQILNILNSLNQAQLSDIFAIGDLLLQTMDVIVRDEAAIAMVWDPSNRRYRPPRVGVADWLQTEAPDRVQDLRFRASDSLSARIDVSAMKTLHHLAMQNPGIQSRYAKILTAVLGSENYVSSHAGGERVYDRMLHTTLRFCSDERVDAAVAASTFETIADQYPNTEHWQFVAETAPGLMMKLFDRFPDRLLDLSQTMNFEVDTSSRLNLWAPTRVEMMEVAEVEVEVARQRALGLAHSPMVNILVEIGRPIEEQVRNQGARRTDTFGETSGEDVIEAFVGEIHVAGLLEMDIDHWDGKTLEDAPEDIKITVELMHMLRRTFDAMGEENADSQIRIICGSFPGRLMGYVQEALTTSGLFESAEIDRIVLNQYDRTTAHYYDAPKLTSDLFVRSTTQ